MLLRGSDFTDRFSIKAKELWALVFSFVKWIAIAVIIGVLVGAVGTLFCYGIEFATKTRQAHEWLIFLLPFAGILIVLLYKGLGMSDDTGTNRVLLAVRSDEKLSIKTMFLIFVSTILTHLCGGSVGREGAALQIGGSLSAHIGRTLKLDDKDKTIITMCGMSAGFAALFGTPIASAVFAMEVVSVGIMHYSALVPCVISALVGATVARLSGLMPMSFNVPIIPEITFSSVGKVLLLAALCAFLSIFFCVCLHKFEELFKKKINNKIVRIVVGGVAIIALTLLIGTQDYNGIGSNIINLAFTENSRPEAFLLKILFTAITLGAGFKGGEIVPVFFVGATFGNLIAQILGIPIAFGTAIGMISVFCGVTNCPLASLFLSVELFGSKGLIFFGISVAVSYMLSGYDGLYSEQKIIYSKLKPQYIDKVIGDWAKKNNNDEP
ncbi:MAG: chloride channel protein [Oscillospiraceae bacterium]